MKTKKLYYEDCHIKTFSACVTGCEETGDGYWITLDATAFYPEGGGQACDTGTLGQVNVLAVREQGETVAHLCDGALPIGQQVTGTIHWQRRFDLMQQHTGEHIVSGILYRMFGFHNVGFHVGKDVMEVDFDGVLPPDALSKVEWEANQAVWENLPVQCYYPSPEALPKLDYRSKRALPWPVRIVEIPGYDKCACCGVHTAFTGEVGIIKILSCVRLRQGVRMEMVCGGRAFDAFSRVYDQNRQVSLAFSAKMLGTGEAAQRMNDALAAQKQRCAALERRLFDGIAALCSGQTLAVHFDEGLSSGGLRLLAEKIAGKAEIAAVFSQGQQGFEVCLAGSPEGVRELSSAMTRALKVRGGGKPGFYQGRVLADKTEIQSFFREWEADSYKKSSKNPPQFV